jgi:hypothetical protein
MRRLSVTVFVATCGLTMLLHARAEEPPKADKSDAAGVAPTPKPLSEAVRKGIDYLVREQHEDGGWGQGGGWRVGDQGNRVEGAQLKDPSDIGNTSIALLALVRAGNTGKDGPYAKNVAKAVAFICSRIEKADDKSVEVTDVKGTQLQSKIGPYVDTFLALMVLAELKGKMGDDASQNRTLAALTKVVGKMEKNQREDGTFAGNYGWASVLSQGLANKGFARAGQQGVAVSDKTIRRVQEQVAANFDSEGKTFRAGAGGGPIGGLGGAIGGLPGRPAVGLARGGAMSAPSDAGVLIYTASTYLTNAADVSNARSEAGKKAREVLERKDASKDEREKATSTLNEIAKADKLRGEATDAVVKQLDNPAFVQGFGSNGGEEFLSFMNIGEALLLKGGDAWKKWDKTMTQSVVRVQDRDGSWSGQHCITGKTFCTSAALLVLMTDRCPVPVRADKPSK